MCSRFSLKQKQRGMDMKNKCHVEGCTNRKVRGNRYLCDYHYRKAEYQTPEIGRGPGLVSYHIHMKDVKARINFPPVIHLSAQDCTQEELERYLERKAA